MSKAVAWYGETIAIGSELLQGGRVDTNSLFLGEQLASIGIELRYKTVVGDDLSDIMAVLQTAVRRARVVVMTGGLGPTVDDLTRDAVAKATGCRLGRRKEALEGMTARLAQWGRSPSTAQLRQALIPAKALVLPNPVGSAPGFSLVWKGAFIASLPGVPREMEAMVKQTVLPEVGAWLAGHKVVGLSPLVRRVFHTVGVPEADVDAALKGVVPAGVPIDLGMLASPLGVLVSLTTKPGHAAGRSRIEELSDAVRGRLREWLYAEGGESMEEVVGRLLADRRLTLGLAESCTGGLIAHRLTQVPGASIYMDRGVVCYSNRAKTDMLGVPASLIAEHGAVSQEVAAAMARGIRERGHVSIGLSVTGIAGPGGATPTKPVGLVYIGLDGGEGSVMTREYRFHGDRHTIKQRSSQAALDLLRRWLQGRTTS
ncbi:MAG: competence/damage-inducible protein A [Nitrospiraceae bacterium]|nr:competence/damage-inducible protein A [Nitrospiraceae bacterium]